jgi:hypothetical protein
MGQTEETGYMMVRFTVTYPGIFFAGVLTNSFEDRGQRERESGGGSPLFRGSVQFANE